MITVVVAVQDAELHVIDINWPDCHCSRQNWTRVPAERDKLAIVDSRF